VLTNMESALSDAVCQRVVDAYLGAPPTDWAAAIAGYQRHQDSVGRLWSGRKVPHVRRIRSRHCRSTNTLGRYTDAMYGDATITDEGGHLVLQFSHSPAFTEISTTGSTIRSSRTGAPSMSKMHSSRSR